MSSYYSHYGDRCVNCGIHVRGTQLKRLVPLAELTPAEKQLLLSWLLGYVIPDLESRSMCMPCTTYVRTHAVSPNAPRWFAHSATCVACGKALSVGARRHVFDEQKFPEHKVIRPYFQHHKDDKAELCQSCHEKATKAIKQQNKPVQYVAPVEDKDLAKTLFIHSYWKLEAPKLVSCIVCEGADVGRIRLPTRQQVMVRHKLYTPPGARVCAEHAKPDHWTTADKKPGDFTSEQLADMIFLLKLRNPIDLGDVGNLAPFTLQEWLGVSLERFEEMLKQTPKLVERNDGRFALAMYLANMHSGECATVLASVCQRPVELVQAAIKLAQECVGERPTGEASGLPLGDASREGNEAIVLDDGEEYCDLEVLEM